MFKSFVSIIVLCSISFLSVAQHNDFVYVKSGNFYLENKIYNYIGANYWYGGLLPLYKNDVERLRRELDFLQLQGITNLRVMAAAEGLGKINGMQRVPIVSQPRNKIYNENFFHGLDILLDEMGKRKMKAVLFLSNNWEWSGGFLQYLNWNGLLPDSVLRRKLSWDENRDYVKQFYSCGKCMDDYLQQLQIIINRKNKVNQKFYKEDATIMAWQVANEPRPMRSSANEAYAAWLKKVTATIKSLDKNHLVSLGVEGEQGTESIPLYEQIQQDKNVDYLTIHIWPKNWMWFKDTAIADGMETVKINTQKYIEKHLAIAEKLQKPLVLEEFGLPRDGHTFVQHTPTVQRDAYYDYVFSFLVNSVKKNRRLRGANFWTFGGYVHLDPNRPMWEYGDDLMGDPPVEEQGLNAVFPEDASTWNVIKRNIQLIK